ncbi:hypothetical protein AB0D12_23715 [Streptomyces sp. NPDC048479]|uniref:hypothetical protein n=1 Tax=Streptomyces sp. NPDC048479 TaxID=3154725 RepID=UPI003444846C
MRAVVLLLGFLTLGTALFTAWPPTVVGDGKAPHFQAAIYTLDLLQARVVAAVTENLSGGGVLPRRADASSALSACRSGA